MAELKVPEQWGKGLDLGWKEGWTLEMQEYSEELKRLENAAKEGYNPETNTWVSHPSPEDPKGLMQKLLLEKKLFYLTFSIILSQLKMVSLILILYLKKL